jgi:hypothetical protein
MISLRVFCKVFPLFFSECSSGPRAAGKLYAAAAVRLSGAGRESLFSSLSCGALFHRQPHLYH